MTAIRVKPEELEIVAKYIPDAEDACRRARTSLSWTLPSLAMEIPGIGSAAIRELTDELLHWLQRYEEKLNEAEGLLYRTAVAIRQADQTLADNMKEFGLELLGWYDLQRLFGEYDIGKTRGEVVGKGTGNTELGKITGYKFKEDVDLDFRGTGKTYRDALNEAFIRTGVPRTEFTVTKWGRDANGKSFPVEWRAKNGPDVPHIGYQTGGKEVEEEPYVGIYW
ncbi:hypothetical protein PTHTG4_21010 [Parageobacillus thermoglucosidasius]|nr:hypothetical protein PTHTG4_21010 [Parageobacillus thermoglucosidasius]